jgi:hypothetical protein
MKQKILPLLLIALICCSAMFAQPAVKIYAYSQVTTGGMKPSDVVTENGEKIKAESKSPLSYLLYFTYSGSAPVKITGIWINQKAYNVKTGVIKKTPVTIPENNAIENSKNITLVPKTKNKVLQLELASPITDPVSLSGDKKKAVKESELVITYTVNGKKYYKAVKKITILKPAFAS